MKNNSIIAVAILFSAINLKAQSYFGGSDIFRIGNTGSRTINNATDVITVGLVSVDLTKTSGLFKEDASAGVLVKATISGYDKPTRTNQATTIERLYLVDVTNYQTGQISLPIEGTLFDNFQLTYEKNVYTKVELEITLLKKRKSTDFSFVLKNVAKLTQSLPFPTNPFDPIVKTFAGTITDMLNPQNDAENNIRERIPTGTISLNFLPNSQFATTTGIFAVIFGSQPPLEAGYIDIKKPTDYIFSFQSSPKRAILISTKDAPISSTELKNDNVMFFIEAYSSNVDKAQIIKTSFKKPELASIITSNEIQNEIASFNWYPKTGNTFNSALQTALKEFNKSNGEMPFIKPGDMNNELVNIGSTELLMIDYIQTIKQRKELGLAANKLNDIATPGDYLLK